MAEIEEAAHTITEKASPDANIIFGASIDPSLKNRMKITVIATGFDESHQRIYGQVKKPVFTPQTSTHASSSTPSNSTPPQPLDQDKITELLGNKNIPVGVDISDSFDIPSFLKKNS